MNEVEWFKSVVREIEYNILAQKSYLNDIVKTGADRVILGRKVYEMLGDAFVLSDNTIHGLHIAVDCDDDWVIAVCHGAKADAQKITSAIEEQ